MIVRACTKNVLQVAEPGNSEDELLPLEGAKSAGVWRHFGILAWDGKFIEPDKRKRKELVCKLCHQCLKYSGNTTNLHFHLHEHHPSEFGSLQSHDSHEKQSSRPVLTVAEAFKAASHTGPVLAWASKRWTELTDAIRHFIARDMQPYDTVNDTGFWHMIRVFEPRYILPDRKTVATHCVPKMYEQEKGSVKQQLTSIGLSGYFALTTDLWSSRSKHSYMYTG